VDEAVQEAVAKLEREAFRRGVEGWVERGVFDKDGRRPGDVVRYSDRMLELALKRHIPEYRERAELDVNAHLRADVRARLDVDAAARHQIALEFALQHATPQERQVPRSALQLMAAAEARVDHELLEARVRGQLPALRQRMLAANSQAEREAAEQRARAAN
jgi:hypothetical protein